ncbi:tRNA lysidine(34) synthetase TilS [Alkanindiges sp. WGS2144]|uniref:tRNA lysidine(34) synthetase TilS n=1 Tax=Alkanindiges sp. WGS2144 TaxID=3366808 RepID=UPI00375370DF
MSGTVSASDAFWQQPVTRQLQQQLNQFEPSQRFLVACSGGRDSLSLTRALQLLCPGRVRIVHINHQLQAPARQWADWLSTQCTLWDLPHVIKNVQVKAGNVEEQARNARYAALFETVQPDEVLVLGHHQQDQAETVFLRLLSGSGVVGLSAMKMLEQRHGVQLWRPLLQCTRAHITQLAALICPQYIDDPANQQQQFDRVFLRQQVWPLLSERWPALNSSLSRSATLMQDCSEILQDVVQQDWQRCGNEQQLDIDQLLSLSPARQRLLISRWMQGKAQENSRQQYAPAFHLVEQLRQALIEARQDAAPKVEWQGWQFRRYQKLIYRLPKQLVVANDQLLDWQVDQQINVPSGLWRWQEQTFGFPLEMLAQPWTLQARRGGEVLHLRGRAGRWPLKKSLQSAGLAPWQRQQVHLLIQGELVLGVLTSQGFWPAVQPAWVAQGWLPERIS